VIQFACPSCKSACSVDDKFAGRKLKCPKCGARVLHGKDGGVTLLTAGSAVPPKPAAPSTATDATQPMSDVTPLATAVLPHSVGDLVNSSESKQNFYVGAGLLLFFAIVATVLGIILGQKLLVVTPIAVVLVAAGIYLWLHIRKLKSRLIKK
jgi:DNA-directed RNA polymerase subunit RPC12/RpoP